MLKVIIEYLLPALSRYLNPRFGGGGSGGGGQVYYANQDKLLGVQADIAEGIYNNIYQPNAPDAIDDLAGLRKEAMDGTLAHRARVTAGADAGAAVGMGINAANRSMERYGSTANPNTRAALLAQTGIAGAALRADGMNKASAWAEDQKWGRAYDFYNALSGIPSSASSSAGAAASGYGQIAGQITESNNANAAGWGRAGGFIGNALFARDGGKVVKHGSRATAVRMASGGLMRLPAWRSRQSGVRGAPVATPMENFLSSMSVGAGAQVLKGAMKPAVQAAKNGITDALGITQQPAVVADAVAKPVLNGAVGDVAVAAPVADTAAGITATELAPVVGEAAAAEVAAPAIAEAVAPELALLLLKDGGKVGRCMDKGGEVVGRGGPTDDKVPAMLSDGEFVVNAKAVEMVGEEVLNKINNAGLAARGDLGKKNKPSHFAMGGIGIALGSAVDEVNRQKQIGLQDQANARANEMLQIHKGEDARSAAMHDMQMKTVRREMADDDAFRSQLANIRDDVARIRGGDITPAQNFINDVFNEQSGPFNGGDTVQLGQKTPDGGVAGVYTGADGTQKSFALDKNQVVDAYVKGKMGELAFSSPKQFLAWVGRRQEQAKLASEEKIAAGHDATSMANSQGQNATSIRVARIHEGGANARNAASVGISQDNLDLSRKKDAREQDRIDKGNQALSDMDAAERSGDAKAYNDARRRAIQAGIKLDKPEVQKADVKVGQTGDITVTQPTGGGGAVVTNYGPDMNPRGSVTVPPPGQSSQVHTPKNEADFKALPRGAVYIDPQDGKKYRKP